MCSRPTTTVLRLIWPPVTLQLLMPAVLSCYRRLMPLLGCMHRMCHDNEDPIAVSFHAFCKALNGALRHMPQCKLFTFTLHLHAKDWHESRLWFIHGLTRSPSISAVESG